jgi:hypothetical protein
MTPATLSDGREVDTASEDWRCECEAKAVLRLPFNLRKTTLEDIERKRGKDARKALEARIVQIWTDGRLKP